MLTQHFAADAGTWSLQDSCSVAVSAGVLQAIVCPHQVLELYQGVILQTQVLAVQWCLLASCKQLCHHHVQRPVVLPQAARHAGASPAAAALSAVLLVQAACLQEAGVCALTRVNL
jgi:hypothetical protein